MRTLPLSSATHFVGHPPVSPSGSHSSRGNDSRLFENALFRISDFLTEAVGMVGQGRLEDARSLFRRAELYALLSGSEELIRLVSVYWQEWFGGYGMN